MSQERIAKNLTAAIDRMQCAVEDARRQAKTADATAVQRVLHALAWGFANASSGLECAMAAVSDAHERQVYELNKLNEAPDGRP